MVDELRIPVSGGELAVRDYGGPGRTVVLVHSVGYSSDVWRRFAPLLAQSHRVLAVDLRGHGQTTAQVDVVDDVVADFERLVAVLELRCPVIVGHQYGGGVAAAVAAAYPLLWGGLCLIDSPAIGPREDYLGLMQIFASESMLDELVARFALGAEGHGPEALEAFLESRGVPMATDWLSVPRVGGNDYSLLRAILRDGSGGWVRQPTRQTVLRLTEIADFPYAPGRELLERVVAPVWALQPTAGEYGQGFEHFAQLARTRVGWVARSLCGGSFVAHTDPQLLRNTLVALLARLPNQGEPVRALDQLSPATRET